MKWNTEENRKGVRKKGENPDVYPGVPKGEVMENWTEVVVEEIMAGNFSKLVKKKIIIHQAIGSRRPQQTI